MNKPVKDRQTLGMSPCSRLWMAYFLFTIALIGFPLSVGLYIPLYLLSFFYEPLLRPADFIMRMGIGWLMDVQPWLKGDFYIDVPYRKGVLLAGNHRSHLDVFLLLSRVRGIRVLAKDTLFWLPGIGLMMRVSRQIPARRGDVRSFQNAMDRIERDLKRGETVQVFPEMHRCEPFATGTRNFLVAPFLAAKKAGAPVIPVVIEGTDGVWPKGTFALRPRAPVRMRTLAPIDPSAFPTAEALAMETRRRIEEAMTPA